MVTTLRTYNQGNRSGIHLSLGFPVQDRSRKASRVIPPSLHSKCWIDSNEAGNLYVQWTHDIHSTVTKGCPCPAVLFLRYDKDSETHMNSNGGPTAVANDAEHMKTVQKWTQEVSQNAPDTKERGMQLQPEELTEDKWISVFLFSDVRKRLALAMWDLNTQKKMQWNGVCNKSSMGNKSMHSRSEGRNGTSKIKWTVIIHSDKWLCRMSGEDGRRNTTNVVNRHALGLNKGEWGRELNCPQLAGVCFTL